MAERLPTMLDVARASGCSKSTVQRALSGSGWVAAEAKERILAAAKELGWRRDPRLASLAHRRWEEGRHHEGLLVMAEGADSQMRDDMPVWQAFSQTARELGYRTDRVRLGPSGDGWRTILAKRTAGIVLTGVIDAAEIAPAPWPEITAVSLGVPGPHLPIHTIDTDAGAALEMAWKHLVEAGCKRPLLVHLAEYRHLHNAERIGRFLWLQQHAPAGIQRLPVVEARFSSGQREVQKQVRELKPDGIIGVNDWVYWLLKDDGWRFPAQARFVSLARDNRRARIEWAGLDTEDAEQARAAVELLDLLVVRRATGLPRTPRMLRVQPTWRDPS